MQKLQEEEKGKKIEEAKKSLKRAESQYETLSERYPFLWTAAVTMCISAFMISNKKDSAENNYSNLWVGSVVGVFAMVLGLWYWRNTLNIKNAEKQLINSENQLLELENHQLLAKKNKPQKLIYKLLSSILEERNKLIEKLEVYELRIAETIVEKVSSQPIQYVAYLLSLPIIYYEFRSGFFGTTGISLLATGLYDSDSRVCMKSDHIKRKLKNLEDRFEDLNKDLELIGKASEQLPGGRRTKRIEKAKEIKLLDDFRNKQKILLANVQKPSNKQLASPTSTENVGKDAGTGPGSNQTSNTISILDTTTNSSPKLDEKTDKFQAQKSTERKEMPEATTQTEGSGTNSEVANQTSASEGGPLNEPLELKGTLKSTDKQSNRPKKENKNARAYRKAEKEKLRKKAQDERMKELQRKEEEKRKEEKRRVAEQKMKEKEQKKKEERQKEEEQRKEEERRKKEEQKKPHAETVPVQSVQGKALNDSLRKDENKTTPSQQQSVPPENNQKQSRSSEEQTPEEYEEVNQGVGQELEIWSQELNDLKETQAIAEVKREIVEIENAQTRKKQHIQEFQSSERRDDHRIRKLSLYKLGRLELELRSEIFQLVTMFFAPTKSEDPDLWTAFETWVKNHAKLDLLDQDMAELTKDSPVQVSFLATERNFRAEFIQLTELFFNAAKNLDKLPENLKPMMDRFTIFMERYTNHQKKVPTIPGGEIIKFQQQLHYAHLEHFSCFMELLKEAVGRHSKKMVENFETYRQAWRQYGKVKNLLSKIKQFYPNYCQVASEEKRVANLPESSSAQADNESSSRLPLYPQSANPFGQFSPRNSQPPLLQSSPSDKSPIVPAFIKL